MKVKIVLLDDACKPEKATSGSAGYDLKSRIDYILKPGEIKVIPVGIKLNFDAGYKADILPRSGLSLKKRIRVANAPGLCDSDYPEEYGVILVNDSDVDFDIKKGDRIAQMTFTRYEEADYIYVNDIKQTTERSGGFGHTGIDGSNSRFKDMADFNKKLTEAELDSLTKALSFKSLTDEQLNSLIIGESDKVKFENDEIFNNPLLPNQHYNPNEIKNEFIDHKRYIKNNINKLSILLKNKKQYMLKTETNEDIEEIYSILNEFVNNLDEISKYTFKVESENNRIYDKINKLNDSINELNSRVRDIIYNQPL